MRWLLPLLLCGCASPYAEIGVGHNFRTNLPGRDPTAHFEVGLEWDKGFSCGITHWSHYRDGWPTSNSRTEAFKDEIMCKKRWGGK